MSAITNKELETINESALEHANKAAVELARLTDDVVDLTTHLESARLAMEQYQEYRRMNTLNFQLEKADSYINVIAAALKKAANG